MYDVAAQVGRVGVEVQTTLLADPAALNFDPDDKKIGTQLRADVVADLPPAPSGWRWTADACASKSYI